MEVRPGYKQTQVGVIPETWSVDRLEKYWSVTDCKHVTAEFVDNGYPLASIKEVQSRFVELTNAKQTTQMFYNLLTEGGRKPRVGDLIISRNATVGEVAQVADWHPLFAMGQDVCLLRKRDPEDSTDFLQAVFRSPVIANQLSDFMVGSTFKRINVQQIKSFTVPMPPPTEQRAIAAVFCDVDALLGGLEGLIAKKRNLKQAAMQQLLTGQTRLPGFSGEWEVKHLKHFVTQDRFAIVDGPFGSQLKVEEYVESGVPVIEMEHLNDDFITERIERYITPKKFEDLKRSAVYPGDIIVSKTGSLGKLGLIPEGVKRGLITSRLAKITLDPLRADRFFVFQCLWKLRSEGYWEKVSQGGTMQILGIGMLQNAPIPNISIPEQTAIAAVLSDMDAELAALEARRDKTRALKQGMMQELLTGRTRLV